MSLLFFNEKSTYYFDKHWQCSRNTTIDKKVFTSYRDTIERPEGIEAGTAMLVGANKEFILKNSLLTDQNE